MLAPISSVRMTDIADEHKPRPGGVVHLYPQELWSDRKVKNKWKAIVGPGNLVECHIQKVFSDSVEVAPQCVNPETNAVARVCYPARTVVTSAMWEYQRSGNDRAPPTAKQRKRMENSQTTRRNQMGEFLRLLLILRCASAIEDFNEEQTREKIYDIYVVYLDKPGRKVWAGASGLGHAIADCVGCSYSTVHRILQKIDQGGTREQVVRRKEHVVKSKAEKKDLILFMKLMKKGLGSTLSGAAVSLQRKARGLTTISASTLVRSVKKRYCGECHNRCKQKTKVIILLRCA